MPSTVSVFGGNMSVCDYYHHSRWIPPRLINTYYSSPERGAFFGAIATYCCIKDFTTGLHIAEVGHFIAGGDTLEMTKERR